MRTKQKQQEEPPKSLIEQARESQFAQNLVRSGKEFGSELWNAAAGIPTGETPRAIGNLALGTAQLMSGASGPGADYTEYPRAVGGYYAGRYGSLADMARTGYEDPVGTLADASMLLSLGGTGVRGAAAVPRAMGMARTAGALEATGKGLRTAGAMTDPLRLGFQATTLPLRSPVDIPLVSRLKPENLYQSAMKPRPSLSDQPGRIERMVQTGLEERIPVSEAGLKKGWGIVDELNKEVQGYIDDATARGVTIDPLQIRKRIDDVRQQFSGQFISADDLKKIDKLEQKFLAEHATPSTGTTTASMTPAEAQEAKQKAYRKLKGKYGKKATDSQVEFLKGVARGANEELRAAIPEITEPNVRESKLLDFLPELQRTVSRTKNYQLLSLNTPAVATATYALTGDPKIAGTLSVLHAIFEHPMAKSKLALAIYYGMKANPGKYGPARMATATARANEYVESLRQGSRSATSEAPPPTPVP